MLGGEEDVDGDDRGGDDHIGDGDDGNTTSCQLFVRKVTKNKSFMIMIDYSDLVVMIVLTGTFADCKKVTIIMIIVIMVMKSVLVTMKMLNIYMILAMRID